MLRGLFSRQNGWTLIELTIVISLITVLATIAIAGYGTAITRSREAVLKEDLFRMRDAIDQYYADRQEYPESIQSLVDEGYLRSIPNEPFTGTIDSWQPMLSPYDPNNPTSTGIYDVNTTNEGTALDGSLYSDW